MTAAVAHTMVTSRPPLYIMRVQRAKLEVRALAAHGGRHMVRTRGGLRG